MPLFKKSHKKADVPIDNTTAGHHDPVFSGGSGANPNLMSHDQPGAHQGPGSGYPPSHHPYPNEPNNTRTGNLDHHTKPSKFSGKVETAVGSVIGSDTLRAKGMEKEREARDLNVQSSELAQAESLEREAQMHRDRALGGVGGDRNTDRRFN